jgi:DNA invertase Pin-like site-specific DNA recombinase
MLIGYARVCTSKQETAAQVTALKAAGCERIYREKVSGGRWNRPELHRLLDQLRKGDVLVVWKLDRLSRSLRDVLTIIERLAEAKAGFRSLTEAIDTTTPAGRMMRQMVGSFAEFETSDAAGAHEDWFGDGPPGRANWRTSAETNVPAASRDNSHDFQGE